MKFHLGALIVLSLFAFGDAFQLGTEQTYRYQSEVRAGSARNASRTVGYIVKGKVHVATVWGDDEHKLLRFKISDIVLHTVPGDVTHKTTLSAVSTSPFYAHWNLGHVKTLYTSIREDVSLVNFKKGIASLFQYQLLDGSYVEVDPSGTCDVQYTSYSSTRYHKAKTNCKFPGDRFERTEYPLRSLGRNSRSTDLTVGTEGTLEKVVAQDYLKYVVNAYDNVGAFIEAVTKLDLEGSADGVNSWPGTSIEEVVKQINLEEYTLTSQEFGPKKCEGVNCHGLVKLIKNFKNSLTNEQIGKQDASAALIELVQLGRKSSSEELNRIIKAKTLQEQKGQLLDLLGAIQTVESHAAAKSILTYETDEELFLAERYLQALAVGSRPKRTVIQDLLAMAEKKPTNDKFYDTLVQTIASMAHRYARLPSNSYDTDLVEMVKEFLLKRLEECRKDSCKQKYIRGFHNLKSPKTLEVLVKLALEGSPKISVTAMKALRSFSVFVWDDDFKAIFEDIFFQASKKFDSSARALALDILLDLKPDTEELTHIMQYLKSKDKVYEVKQYLLQKLHMLASRCPDFAEMLKKIVRRDPKLNNYHVIGARGLSTALTRTYSTAPSFNSSLVSLQEMSGGVLKRGIVDLTLEAEQEQFSMFTLGLFAGGLSSFVSSGDNEEIEDDSDSIAGMELTVQSSVLRPLVFFDGKGELMGHVWSGTASEPTPAYQATTLLQDNEERFPLQNGAAVKLSTIGAISIDLNGQVTMSLWGRNAHSKVEQNTGIAVHGSLSLETSFVGLSVDFNMAQEPQLHLTSDLDFSSESALCMQLMQPNSVLTYKVTNRVFIPEARYQKVLTTKITHNIPGYTHALNQKNNAMCNLIASSS
ncbi:microsomal triacylglycerol transfer protein isoform X2 [Toxorhynchites rutilus septentrionalis]|uniref:microsomal triacylglycerol transfer protein isoform X2 n=1 Tax=Toxorhynchites rutilus septentrionalis TaxID=329112 RepID=UPI0024799F29|nr:microsomal triacylglycerol transfer protein isoform X2 [Toxorhynchites rutilus septentrionalis]